MSVRVVDLIDQTGTPGPRPVLHCCCCGSDASANKSDYFMFPPHHVFQCCGEDMQLAIKKVVYEPVSLPQKENCATEGCPNVSVFITSDNQGLCGPCYKKKHLNHHGQKA